MPRTAENERIRLRGRETQNRPGKTEEIHRGIAFDGQWQITDDAESKKVRPPHINSCHSDSRRTRWQDRCTSRIEHQHAAEFFRHSPSASSPDNGPQV